MHSNRIQEAKQGRLVVVSGPSGVGKTSVVSRLLEVSRLPLRLSVSATTRPCRAGERNHTDYHFLSNEEFEQKRLDGEFLECFEVYGKGYWYGTLSSEVAPFLNSGKWIILEIDVQGARAVLEKFPDAVTIFVRPENWDVLESRLRGRATESEEVIARRLEIARYEMDQSTHYRYQIVNRSIDQSAGEIDELLQRLRGTHD